MSIEPQNGKCYQCNSNAEMWYYDGGYYCRECIMSFLDGKPMHDDFMLAEWIKIENMKIGQRSNT